MEDRRTSSVVRRRLFTASRHLAEWSAPLALCAVLLTTQGGCTRHFFRNWADKEALYILEEKDKYPLWQIEQFYVYPHPLARFAQSGHPDRPPKPPDDPATDSLSPDTQKPYKDAGVGYFEGTGYLRLLENWDAQNRAAVEAERAREEKEKKAKPGRPDTPVGPGQKKKEAEPGAKEETDGLYGGDGGQANYDDPFETKEAPQPFLLKLEQSVELGLINSREFQDRREDLYLTALPVTVERFAFSTQFFAAEQLIRERLGSEFPGGPANRWVANSNFGFSKFFSTGALLLFQFANRTAIELTNPASKHTISESTISLDFIQPLLRGGGRAVALEPLTLVERNLLYEIRDFARFRKQFFVNIAAGAAFDVSVIGATRFRQRPSTFGGNLGVTGANLLPGRGGVIGLAASGTGRAAGYLPVLLASAQLENQKKNVVALQGILDLYQAFLAGGQTTRLQLARVEQQLLQGLGNIYDSEVNYRDALDRFKIQLGLPVNLPMELDDTLLRPQRAQLRRFEVIGDEFDAARREVDQLITVDEPAVLRARLRQLATGLPLVEGTNFQTGILGRWKVWEMLSAEELARRRSEYDARLKRLLEQRDRLTREAKPVPEELRKQIEETTLELQVGRFEAGLRLYEVVLLARPLGAVTLGGGAPLAAAAGLAAGLAPTGDEALSRRANLFRFTVLADFLVLLEQARQQRLGLARQAWPDLPPLCVSGVDLLAADFEQARAVVTRTALTNRFDLMNVRAQLVDAWRQIRLAANALFGVFNVEYHLTSNTPVGLAQPLAFAGSRSRHQLVFDTELPLVRILERNSYRASLIAWQRQRRTFMQTEDSVVQGVRNQLRQLRVLQENYKIQQRAVELAYLQVEQARYELLAPPQPAGGGVGGPPPAAGLSPQQTQQLLEAQGNVVQAQNNLFQVWVNYITTRMQLYRDLELMPLDPRGVWTDDAATCECPPDHPARKSSPGTREGEQRDGQRPAGPAPAPQGPSR